MLGGRSGTRGRPSILALTRQGVPTLRREHTEENLSARGAYVISRESGGEAKAVIMASGSEVEIAVEAQKLLADKGIPARVVSMPSWELFEAQDEAYRHEVLGTSGVRVAIEAASTFGWERYVGNDGAIIGMTSFGASAPYKELYTHFGITADAVLEAVLSRL